MNVKEDQKPRDGWINGGSSFFCGVITHCCSLLLSFHLSSDVDHEQPSFRCGFLRQECTCCSLLVPPTCSISRQLVVPYHCCMYPYPQQVRKNVVIIPVFTPHKRQTALSLSPPPPPLSLSPYCVCLSPGAIVCPQQAVVDPGGDGTLLPYIPAVARF